MDRVTNVRRTGTTAPPGGKTPAFTSTGELRRRARLSVREGAVTPDCDLDGGQIDEALSRALATEWIRALRYERRYLVARGHARPAADRFIEHAQQELEHADRIAERGRQLGDDPDLDPDSLSGRSHAQYRAGTGLVEMIDEDGAAARIAIERYREVVQFIGERDPTTRRLPEEILAVEEEHAADDPADLLDAQRR